VRAAADDAGSGRQSPLTASRARRNAQACISSSVAIASAAEKILAGHASVVVAGGTETFSDVPIRLSRAVRQKLITLPKALKKGGPLGAARHLLRGLKAKDLALETPAIANYTTGEVSQRGTAERGVLILHKLRVVPSRSPR
jgi:acetyl-CoA acyltransferase